MRLSHQVALATLSKTVKHISVFVLSIVLARTLTTENYGIYLQVQLIVSTLLYLAIFGVPHSIYFFLPRSSQPRRLIGYSALALCAVAVLLASTLYANIKTISEMLSNPSLVDLAVISAGLLFFQIPIKLFEPAMIAAKKVPTFVALNATFNFAFFFPIAIPALLGWTVADILASMLAFYIIQFLAIMTTLLMVTLGLKPVSGGDRYSFRDQVVYSVPIGLSGVVGEVSRQADKVIVGGFFDPSQYAIYTRGAMEIPLLNVISNSLHNIMMPRFVEAFRDGDKATLLDAWQSAIRMMAAFVYPACVLFVTTGDLFIPFLYSDRFAEASIIFQIYMLTLLVRVTTGDAILRAIGRTDVLLKLSVLAIGLNIALTVGLIKLLGIIGAPIATVLTSYFLVLVYVRIVARMLEIRVSDVFPWQSLARILSASIGAGLVASSVRLFDQPDSATLGASCVVFALSYLWLFRVASVFSGREKNAVRSLLPRRMRWIV